MRVKFLVRRKAEGLTQAQLGEKLGVSGKQISYIENGSSNGSHKFWNRVKELWGIPNSEMEDYRQNT